MKTELTRCLLAAATVLAVTAGFALFDEPTIFGQNAPQRVSRIPLEQLKWVDEPEGLGFKQAAVEGDRTKPGLYIVLVKFPPGVMSKPHFHREDRFGTVIKGTWYTGDGDEFAPDKTVPLKPGSFMKHPAGAHHYDGSKDEEVIVELVGIGPTSTTKVRPNEPLFAPSVKK